MSEPVVRRADGAPVEAMLCPGGPMIVRGAVVVQGADGTDHASHRGVSAVCRCGKSALAPWCDGTHKLLPGGR
ncbi:CDGSH iron-sulfur domain-containing protein [Nocardioides plantarum]|uniref:CDGSH iron-sulfur domain-containing protein n=1 Tax=Nocardioides plantarum TaxID=29299 RepID=A0ABV5KFN1_9ACTN|nr:CDGSH iron-sulfur domain-containing protein [Nocardioides plantarum]